MYKVVGFILPFVLLLYNCYSYSPEVTKVLIEAKYNRSELVKVLKHYQLHDRDSLKYKAACFLVENMHWHKSYRKIEYVDPKIPKLFNNLDYVYTQLLENFNDIASLDTCVYLRKKLGYFTEVIYHLMEKANVDTNVVLAQGVFDDSEEINAEFLISHIDNAFDVWENSVYASHLTFDEFCEYILPYRAFWGSSFLSSGAVLNKQFAKHLWHGFNSNINEHLKRYNHYVNKMFIFGYSLKLSESIGVWDLFLGTNKDCVCFASNACDVFRACGFPAVVDYAIAFKAYPGSHYYCSLIDSNKIWWGINPGSSRTLSKASPTYHTPLNIYRNTYAAQKNTPYFLKTDIEKIPFELSHPCIKDVTSGEYELVKLNIPFKQKTNNNLAYLASYSSSSSSKLIAITWGKINKSKGEAMFENALYNTLYFPVYLENDSFVSFGEPFYVIKDSLQNTGYSICQLYSEKYTEETGSLIVTRKYPCKEHLKETMEHMVGGRFEGANNKDFSDAVTLYTITTPPAPYWQEYNFNNKNAYRYYRYVAPEKYPWSNIAELEFLTSSNTTYPNVALATPLPIFNDADTIAQSIVDLKVMEKDTVQMRRKAYADGNIFSISRERYNSIYLNEKVRIEKVRIIPHNAGNGIQPGKKYLLMYWDNGWKEFRTQCAQYQYLKFENVPLNKLYWLQSLDHEIEDLPFIYENGKQKFLYESVIVDRNTKLK